MKALTCLVLVAALTGCASYSWRSSVPEGYRTIAVPVFENRSDVTELGAVVTRQVLREIQREGTFEIRPTGESALELQGVIVKTSTKAQGYRRVIESHGVGHDIEAEARVSLIDKTRGAVLFDDRVYRATASFAAGDDVMTGERNASGRLAEEFARQIVDDITTHDYTKGE